MLNNVNMVGSGESSAIYDALMAVKPEGMSLNQWAQRAGINRSIFNGIKAHGNPTAQTLERLLAAIDVDPATFRTRLQPVRTEVRATGMNPEQVRDAWSLPDARMVPIHGTAFGTELAELEGLETIELMMSETLDYLARPPSLAHDEHAYAVTVIGDSQAPRFEPGEIAFVSPKAPVNVGDDVLVQLRNPEDEGEDNQLAGHVTLVLLKRLVRRTASSIELQQFNPAKTFTVPMKRVQRMHRVRGRL